MTENAQAMADEINKKAKGLKSDTVEIFAVQPFRSGDSLYRLDAAKADGDRLDLYVADETDGKNGETSKVTISVWAPKKLAVSKKKIEIDSASKVKWGDRMTFDVKGDTVEVTTPNQKAQPRDLAAVALSIRFI